MDELRVPISQIVVGTDLSDEAQTAIDRAVALAQHFGATLSLVFAGPVPRPAGTAHEGSVSAEFDRLMRLQLDEAREALRRVRERTGLPGDRVGHVVVDAMPGKALAQVAQDSGAQLVVVGSHGRTGFKRFLLGSVAERAVRLCRTAVLVVRPSPAPTAAGYRHVLVPTDFSASSERALQLALTLAAPGATIELVHVWQPTPAPWASAELLAANLENAQEITAYARAAGQAWLERYATADVALRFDDVEGDPASAITTRLAASDYDLCAIGSHGPGGWQPLLGSVAERVVRHAPCSVVVVPPPTTRTAED